jgi:hypothetical protein
MDYLVAMAKYLNIADSAISPEIIHSGMYFAVITDANGTVTAKVGR